MRINEGYMMASSLKGRAPVNSRHRRLISRTEPNNSTWKIFAFCSGQHTTPFRREVRKTWEVCSRWSGVAGERLIPGRICDPGVKRGISDHKCWAQNCGWVDHSEAIRIKDDTSDMEWGSGIGVQKFEQPQHDEVNRLPCGT